VKNPSKDANYWIEKLGLEPHPEGGYFRQTYKSELKIVRAEPPQSHPVAKRATRVGQPGRAASTAIYFLLEGENFSALHRLRSDEMWHFYAGSPLLVHVISPEGTYASILLGNDPDRGEMFQGVVKAGCWFGSHVADWKGWTLVGCTVAPGFEFEDFELAKREELVKGFPQHSEIIQRLSRE
jgi:uncharacterized protein